MIPEGPGLLLDVEGTLVESWRPVPRAPEAIRELRDAGVPFRLVTNTTSITRAELVRRLRDVGVDVRVDEVVTAPVATAAYLRSHHAGARCLLLGEGGAAEDLDGVELVGDRAGVVVVAGADRAYTWEHLNAAFRMLLDGAALVAMHRNLSWRTDEGMSLDAGAFLPGLERAAGVEATVIGKPSPEFFLQAIELLGVPAERAVMVGDDLESDVLAAQRLGMTGVLVRTGKFRQDWLDDAGEQPDQVVDSIADVPALLT